MYFKIISTSLSENVPYYIKGKAKWKAFQMYSTSNFIRNDQFMNENIQIISICSAMFVLTHVGILQAPIQTKSKLHWVSCFMAKSLNESTQETAFIYHSVGVLTLFNQQPSTSLSKRFTH